MKKTAHSRMADVELAFLQFIRNTGCVPLDLRLGVPGRSLRPMLARIQPKAAEFAAILGSVDQNRRNPTQLQALTSFSRRSSGTHPVF